MKIAVLMSTYNGEAYLNEQLESLANQTVADKMTVYIRDDGSSDRTLEIIASWKERMDLVLLQGGNLGPANSFWALIKEASIQADYYAFCDQDDIWDADKLEISINHLQEGAMLYICNCRLVDAQGKLLEERYRQTDPEISLARLFISGVAQGCAMTFTNSLRSLVAESAVSSIPMHDIIVMLYAYCCGNIYWDSTPRFSYRVHGSNVVAKSNKSLLQKIKTTQRNWKNGSRNSMTIVAAEMLQNLQTLTDEDKKYLTLASRCRKSLMSKIKLLRYKTEQPIPEKLYRSFCIRVLLDLL